LWDLAQEQKRQTCTFHKGETINTKRELPLEGNYIKLNHLDSALILENLAQCGKTSESVCKSEKKIGCEKWLCKKGRFDSFVHAHDNFQAFGLQSPSRQKAKKRPITIMSHNAGSGLTNGVDVIAVRHRLVSAAANGPTWPA
jgi:hypothetical protein